MFMGGSYQDQVKKKKLDKEAEELEVLGQENEKQAVKEGRPILEEQIKKKKENKNKLLDLIMGASKGNKQSYIFFLGELLQRRMTKVDLPIGWTYKITPTNIGVILELLFMERIFRCAFKPTGDAIYDLNAIDTFGVRAENTIDKYGRINQGTTDTKDN
jgi:hypothetical protein